MQERERAGGTCLCREPRDVATPKAHWISRNPILQVLCSFRIRRAWSLIGRAARCKASKCRDRGFFVASWRHDVAFTSLSGDDMPPWLVGARPSDHEPPPEGPGGVPPCPKGVDAVRWAYADERERKRMVREARG